MTKILYSVYIIHVAWIHSILLAEGRVLSPVMTDIVLKTNSSMAKNAGLSVPGPQR